MGDAWNWKPEHTDRLLEVLGFASALGTWVKDRQVKQCLADVEVPNGIQLPVLLFLLSGKRQRERSWIEAGKSMNEVAEVLAKRMVESDERQNQLLDLQVSLENLAQDGTVLQESIKTYTKMAARADRCRGPDRDGEHCRNDRCCGHTMTLSPAADYITLAHATRSPQRSSPWHEPEANPIVYKPTGNPDTRRA